MLNEPLVSVIIPTYNRAGTIGRAIQSVQDQTYNNLEILVCDDASTDETAAIVSKIASNDSRVHWVGSSQNSGRPAVPRNRGLKLAHGDYVAFLDSDDSWLPSKIEKQIEKIRLQKRFKAVCTNAYRKTAKGQTLFFTHQKKIINFPSLVLDNKVINSSVLLHASLIPLIDGFPEEMPLRAIEDYALWLRVATYTPFAYIEEPLVVYADDTQDSIRYQSPATNLDRNKVLYENFRKWLLQKNRSSYHFIKYTVSYAAIKNFYQKVVPITHRIRRIYAK